MFGAGRVARGAVGGTVWPAAGVVGNAAKANSNTTTNTATTAAIRMGDSLLYA